MVVEQVHLIDVEDAPVGGGDEAGLEDPVAGLDGFLDIERTHQPVFGGAHGQVHDRYLSDHGLGIVVSGFAAAAAYVVFALVMFFAHPDNPDPVPVPIDLLELFRTLTMVGQFLTWALMAAGATAGMYWYKRRDEKAGNRFDPVTGTPVST